MTFSDLEGLKSSSNSHVSVNVTRSLLTTLCLDMNWKANVANNFNRLIETGGLLKVAVSHVHCKRACSVPETVQD